MRSKKPISKSTQIKNLGHSIERHASQLNMEPETLSIALVMSLLALARTSNNAKVFFQTILDGLDKVTPAEMARKIADKVKEGEK